MKKLIASILIALSFSACTFTELETNYSKAKTVYTDVKQVKKDLSKHTCTINCTY